jgi:PhnB protein
VTAFDDLREPTDPISPDRAFAARLRRQVADALGAEHVAESITVPITDPIAESITDPTTEPTTVDVPTVELPARSPTMATKTHTETTTSTTSTASTASTTSSAALLPYIAVAGAADAIEWYRDVFGAVETVRYTADDGRIGHAEVDISGSRLMISDEYPDFGAVGPRTLGGTTTALHLMVPDVDAVWERATARGAAGQRPPEDQPYGDRSCTFLDPFGHRWMVGTHIADPTTAEIEADMSGYTITTAQPAAREPAIEVGYLTMGFHDTERASRFFGELFGWTGETGNAGEGYVHIANTSLPMGFTPDGVDSAPQLYFRVPSIERFGARVRDLGGTVVSEATYPSGGDAVCRDDQGREFHLWEPAPGY